MKNRIASTLLALCLSNTVLAAPPGITSNAWFDAELGQTYEYQVVAEDPEGQVLTYRLEYALEGMSVSDSGLISWEPTQNSIGEQFYAIHVEDTEGLSASQIVEFVVRDPGNQLPTIGQPPITGAQVGTLYQYDLQASDEDGDALTYSLLTWPSLPELVISSEGVVSLLANRDLVGEYWVKTFVRDSQMGEATTEYYLTITDPENSPPTINSAPITEAAINTLYSYSLNATDADGDSLSYSLSSWPANDSLIISDAGVLSWTPTRDDVGERWVSITVDDGFLGKTKVEYKLNVVDPANQSPEFTVEPITSATVGYIYDYTASAVDPDGDELMYTLFLGPEGMEIDSETGRVTWTPVAANEEGVRVKIDVRDAFGGFRRQDYYISVTGEVNLPPEIVSPAIEIGLENIEYTYPVEVQDPNVNDVQTFSIHNSAEGIDVNPSTGIITWLAPEEYVGSVEEFNSQCYVVPTGSVGVIENPEDQPDVGNVFIAPLFLRVKEALEVAGQYTAAESVRWDSANNCLGCHVQTQSLLGLETSIDKASIDLDSVEFLLNELLTSQVSDGAIRQSHPQYAMNQTSLALWALSFYPDKQRTFAVRARALDFLFSRRSTNSSLNSTYWNADHQTAWLNNSTAQTAIVTVGIVSFLKDVPQMELTAAQATTVTNVSALLPRIARHLLTQVNFSEQDALLNVFRLIGLAEVSELIEDDQTLADIAIALDGLDAVLRSHQREDGGWGRTPGGNASDPMVTAWVGLALDYAEPSITDPVVNSAINYLLDSQRADGTWQTNTGLFTTLFGPTSLVMAYLPVALDFLGNPDLRMGDIHLVENAEGAFLLSAEISNRGIANVSSQNTIVNFYSGKNSEGVFLGSGSLATLNSGDQSIASIPISDVSTLGTDVYVELVVDTAIEECDINNNSALAAVVNVRTTDLGGLTDDQIFTLNIHDTNSSPVITTEINHIHQQGQSLNIRVETQDQDIGDAAEFTLVGAPEGIYIDSRTGILRSDPDLLAPGTYQFTVVVEDLRGATAEQVIDITVEENLPPEIISNQVVRAQENQQYYYDVEATDSNLGDKLDYILNINSSGMNIDKATGEISWSPSIEFVESNLETNKYCFEKIDQENIFEPKLKWHWTNSGGGSNRYDDVLSTPVVVQTDDDNGDGIIDNLDVPDIAFIGFNGRYNVPGVMWLVDGNTGQTKWQGSYSNFAWASGLAAADIDSDGLIEFIGVTADRHIVAISNTGALKWISSSSTVVRPGGNPSIHDLDGDGSPEIIHGNRVFDNVGNLLWSAQTNFVGDNDRYDGAATLVYAADINLDGYQEVIIGGSAHAHDGTRLWENSIVGDGYTAIGNFNDDDYAEVVVVNKGRVFLLDYNGEIIWGPILIPGRGEGGAPTIADLDGDGEPEIGVASGDFYVALDTDGTILWTSPTVDASSSVTGSSVFDFEADGRVEVIYADEHFLRIYDGATGITLLEEPNTSTTGLENPVVADIDRDGHAEIIVVSNDLQTSGGQYGVRAFEENSWAPTRPIWNQHSYNIDNVNDDLTIPSNPVRSWLSHNTFRLNTFPDRAALALADITVHGIQYDEATNTVRARIKNRGLAPVSGSIQADIYHEHFWLGEELIGSVTIQDLMVDDEKEIEIHAGEIELVNNLRVDLIIPDYVNECNVENNFSRAALVGVRVYDPAKLFDEQIFAVSIQNVNSAPSIVSSASTSIETVESLAIDVKVEDSDIGDSHRFSLVDAPLGIKIGEYTGHIRGASGRFSPGVYSFSVLVEDLYGEVDEQLHVLTVSAPDNLPPEFTSEYPESISALTDLHYLVSASDPDGDEVVFTLAESPQGMIIDGISGDIYWSPSIEHIGFQYVDITAFDSRGASASQRFAIQVTDPYASNNPPEITSLPSGTVVAGKTFIYNVVANDPDNDTLTYSLRDANAAMEISSAGVFSWLPDITMIGNTFSTEIVVSDGRGGQASQILSLPVNEPANSPPAITSTPQNAALVGQLYEYQVTAVDPDGDEFSITFEGQKPNGMTLGANGLIQWTPSTAQENQIFTVAVKVTDVRGASAIQTFGIAVNIVVEPNTPPEITSIPSSPAIIGNQYQYQVRAVDADGDDLVYELTSDPQAGLSLDADSGLLTWTPAAEQVGQYEIAIRVSDETSAATQTYVLNVEQAPDLSNGYPIIHSAPTTEIVAGELYQYQIIASDPDGDDLTYTLLNPEPASMQIDGSGLLQWSATSDSGIVEARVMVSDGQLSVTQSWSIRVWDEYPPLRVYLDVSPALVEEGEAVTFSVNSTGGGEGAELHLYIDGLEEPLDSLGQTSIVASVFGRHEVVAVAETAEENVEVRESYFVLDTTDTTNPIAEITLPEENAIVTAPTDIIGTASDANLVSYDVYVSPKDKAQWSLIATGTDNIENDVLATFDPTMMLNGQYSIVLQVTDVNGQVESASTVVTVEGDLKVGNFSFTVEDMNVPMVGIPISIKRTYDSRRRFELLDFGFGWTIDYQNVKVEESRVPGRFWSINEYRRGPFGVIADFCVEPQGAPVVTVTLPDGDVEKFSVAASPRCNTYQIIKDVSLVFNAEGDTQSTLEAVNDSTAYYLNGNLVETGYFETPVNPSRYRLTTKAGYIYNLDQNFGIETVIDPNGHTLTYTNDGIFHSSGKAVTFERDSDGRIERVIDPSGNAIQYNYDEYLDLRTVIDRDTAETEYTYNANHGLLDIIDPYDRLILRNIYNDEGRLIGQEDNEGNVKHFDHNIDERTSLVRDLDGRSTLFNYDDRGNVLEEIKLITDGSYESDIVTSFTYDANQNEETRTIGNSTWTTLHSDRNDVEQSCNPLNECVVYGGYNLRGQEGTITDERGNTYSMNYDSIGNLLSVESPEVVDPVTGVLVRPTAGNHINIDGLVSSTTDLRGFTTTYTYFQDGPNEGQKETESNPLNGTTTYTYDESNNVLTETRERTVNDVLVSETVSYDYDDRDRIVRTTHDDGTFTETEYDLAGNVDRERDRFGNWTDYDYDVYGRLILTTYPDGSQESRTYTREGLLDTVEDSMGRVTRNEYDDAGRLWRVHNDSDGSFTETRYTIHGWVQFEWDEKRNLTEYFYNDAGRRERVIRHLSDGTTQEHSFTYYPNGELETETDALNHTTTYILNDLDQRVEVQYHNGSSMEEKYDFMGARVETVDQEERAVLFGYDKLGRLTTVTPDVSIDGVAVPDTVYTYDEQGNKLTQTDANGHTTTWTYDYYAEY